MTVVRVSEAPHIPTRVEAVIPDKEVMRRPELQDAIDKLIALPGINVLGTLVLQEYSHITALIENIQKLLYEGKNETPC
jgi:hypothetical protein